MSKKVVAFLAALPALIIFSAFKIVPAVQAILISYRYYDFSEGVFGSKSAGLANYIALFQNELFSGVIKNTIVISSLSILFTCVLAVLLILCISRMPNWILKTIAIVLTAIPAFIPAASFVGVFFKMFSANGIINSILPTAADEPRLFFGDPGYYPFLVSIMDAVRNVYIPVIIGVLVCETRGRKSGAGRIFLVILGYIAARAVAFMSPDIENMIQAANPLVRGVSEVMDTFIYRTGLQIGEMSLASASWVVKSFFQLVISVAVFLLLYFIMPYITEASGTLGEGPRTFRGSVLGIIGFVIFGSASAAMIIMTFYPSGSALGESIKVILNDKGFVAVLSNTLIYGAVSSLIYAALSFFLAYPLVYSKTLYPMYLVILTSLSNNFISEYLLYKQLNLINTIYPVIISSTFSAVGAFALHFSVSCRLRGASCSIGQYLRFSLKPLAVIAVLAFITYWGSFIYHMTYITDASQYGVGFYCYQMLSQSQIDMRLAGGTQISPTDMRSVLIFVSSAVPAALGALLILLNKFLPLTAFSAHMRKG
jgi:putative aldouronate transport system permease protein